MEIKHKSLEERIKELEEDLSNKNKENAKENAKDKDLQAQLEKYQREAETWATEKIQWEKDKEYQRALEKQNSKLSEDLKEEQNKVGKMETEAKETKLLLDETEQTKVYWISQYNKLEDEFKAYKESQELARNTETEQLLRDKDE